MTRVSPKTVTAIGAFAWIAFVALAVMGLGVGTAATDQDVVTFADPGRVAGIVMFLVALVAFVASSVGFALRRRDRASVLISLLLGLITWVAYVFGTIPGWLLSHAISGAPDTDAPRVFVAAFFAVESAARWPAAVVGVAAALVAWGYLAVVARAVREAATATANAD